MKTKEPIKELSIPEIQKDLFVIEIRGTSPLIVHEFGMKSINQIKAIQNKTKFGKELRNPEQEYNDSMYKFADGKRTGFPAVGFKAGMTRAAKQADMNMTDARGFFHVLSDEGDLVEIIGEHRMRTDMVRVANGGTDIRYRAEYPEWSAKLKILYNKNSISREQIVNLINISGFSCGIGEWRPQKSNSGSFGMFEVVGDRT